MFEVGDKVRAFGCDGVVSEVWDAAREALFLIDGGYNTVMCDNEYVSDIHGFITWIEGGRTLEVVIDDEVDE